MSFDKQIQDKFSGFEPEVPDERVDAGWEKIRYFLPPEEKKKRGFFFYRLKGMGMGIAALAVVMIASSITLLLMNHKGNTNTLAALQRKSPAHRSAGFENAQTIRTGTQHIASTQHSEKSKALEASPAKAFKDTMQTSFVSGAQRPAKSSSVAYLNANLSTAAGAPKKIFHIKKTNSGLRDSIQNGTTAFSDHVQGTQSDAMPELLNHSHGTQPDWSTQTTGFMMLMKHATLNQEAPLEPELSPEPALHSVKHLVPVTSSKQKPAFELFAGLSNRSLQLETEQDQKALQSTGFSAGVAALFPVSPRLYVSGQLMISHNPLQYREETGANAIIKKDVVPSASSSLSNYKDTLIYYDPYQSTFELKSGTAYHLSAGLGYQLLNKGRISLEAALLLDFRYMRLNYRINKRLEADTNVFVNNILTTNATSFYESVEKPDAPAPVSEKKQMMTLGLNPSLSLIYQLTKRTGLILRPAYLLQITPNSLHANAKAYRLNENNWFINLGVRYKI
jgi:hypothetical protein